MKIIFIFILLLSSAYAQLPWPVFPTSQQPHITGTVGEFRGSVSSPRFHQGVDITNGSDLRVFAIEAGSVTATGGSGCNKYIDIQSANGTIRYYHIDATVFSGNVAAGQQIGSMTSTTGCAVHVHVQRMGQNLLQNGFAPFDDHTPPTIYAWSVRENGHSLSRAAARHTQNSLVDGLSHRVIGHKVDLVLNADDSRLDPLGMSPGVGAVAPFKLAYQILDIGGNSIGDSLVCNIDFSNPPLDAHAGQVFGTSSTSSNYNWILTAHTSVAPADRYWNTAIRIGEREDWANNSALDAAINEEARYPEGQYLIRFSARDVNFLSDSLPGSYNEVTLDVPVVIDNFRPYVQKVVFQQTNGQTDSTDWLWDGTSLSFRSDTLNLDKYANLSILVHCSEPMKQLSLEIPAIAFQQNITTPVPFSNRRIWAFQLDSTDLKASTACKHQLHLSGLDYADNELEMNPANLAIRQSASSWSPGATPGKDKLHSFFLPENCLVSIAEDASALQVEIYPNPAREEVWVSCGQPFDLSLWNPLGQLVFQKKNITSQTYRLPLHTLAAGMYWVEVGTRQGRSMKLLQLSGK